MNNNPEKTKKRALKILSSRNFSEREMKKRLVDKGESEQDAEEAVAWLVSLGYIDDNNYAALIINHYTEKGYGDGRIRSELTKRGIAPDMQREKLAEAKAAEEEETDGTQDSPAVRYLRKKLRGSKLPDGSKQPFGSYDKEEIRRARDALVRRGFSFEEANDAINVYFESN